MTPPPPKDHTSLQDLRDYWHKVLSPTLKDPKPIIDFSTGGTRRRTRKDIYARLHDVWSGKTTGRRERRPKREDEALPDKYEERFTELFVVVNWRKTPSTFKGPNTAAVYEIWVSKREGGDIRSSCMYVGMTENARRRFSQHFSGNSHISGLIKQCTDLGMQISVRYAGCASEMDAKKLEKELLELRDYAQNKLHNGRVRVHPFLNSIKT